jgi:hypothetical protein
MGWIMTELFGARMDDIQAAQIQGLPDVPHKIGLFASCFQQSHVNPRLYDLDW